MPRTSESQLEHVPLKLLVRGPNVRAFETYDPRKLEELAQSILESGVLQNLTVRKKGAKYEVVIGGRRLAAIEYLHKQGRIDEDFPVPCLIRKISDEEAQRIGLIENIQREDMHWLDEAEAFAVLHRRHSLSPEDIAAKSGKSVPSVLKRIRIAGLEEPTKERIRKGELSFSQAAILSDLTKEDRKGWLEHSRNWGQWGPDHVRSWLNSNGGFPVERAIFTRKEAEGLEVVSGLFDFLPPYYRDGKRARELQMQAAERQVERLKQKWAWAELVVGAYFWDDVRRRGIDPYGRSDDRTKAGAVVWLHETSYAVEVREGLLRLERARPQPDGTVRVERPKTHLTQGTALRAKQAKLEALQIALLHTTDRMVREILVAGLLGMNGLTWARTNPLHVAPEVLGVLGHFSALLESDLKWPRARWEFLQRPLALFEALRALGDGELDTLLRALLASGIGRRDDEFHKPNSAELPAYVGVLAHHLPLPYDRTLPRRAITREFLQGMQLERLQEIYGEMHGMRVGGLVDQLDKHTTSLSKKELIAKILEDLPQFPDYVPAELAIPEPRGERAEAGSGPADEDEYLEDEAEEDELQEVGA